MVNLPMVIVSPLSRVVGPLTNGLFMAYKWGLLTTYLLNGMILQVLAIRRVITPVNGLIEWVTRAGL